MFAPFFTAMRSLWPKVILVIALVWIVAGGVMYWASRAKPSPERLAAFISSNPLEAKSGSARRKIIEEVADHLNALTYEQRREVRMGKQLDTFFRSLTSEEQTTFLDRTLPTGFTQMMASFNKMDPAQRQKFVDRTLREMREREGEDGAPPSDDPNVQKIVQHGLKSFYSEANADVKLDLTPLIEQMQKNVQSGR